ncbi:MAG: NYN domain-containing protein [Oscillospiraceae bacterium]
MKKIAVGILADVDAGKTTLSEALLFSSGALRKKGRVDSGDAFLDTHELEKQRGITIFSKQAVFSFGDTRFTLIDTPGHADFTAETERTLSALDYAILLVSAPDGVAGHTETLWRLLSKRGIPTFIFVNKTDMQGIDRSEVFEDIQNKLSPNAVDFSAPTPERDEAAAMCDETLLEIFDENGSLTDEELAYAVSRRTLIPCFFGSALHSQGVEEFIGSLDRLTLAPQFSSEFSAQVFKIERDGAGKRLTCLKLTGGELKVRDSVVYTSKDGVLCEEKISGIRIYSGGKFTAVNSVSAGDVCSVTGLGSTYSGQGLGGQQDDSGDSAEPVMTYAVIPPKGCDSFTLLEKLKELHEEDPKLSLSYDERHDEITVSLMGRIQTEVLKCLIKQRFGLDVEFGGGRILYRESIEDTVEGVGHFEPLRHYAEVHVILSPLPSGSGILFDSALSEDILDRSWQNLIISCLKAKRHIGVLTGSPITDMKITLTAGRAHPKHTEGGDFREASYRAVRHGLMKAKSVLLEPYYSFKLTVPAAQTGRAINDIRQMNGSFSAPESAGEMSLICGEAPVSLMRDYAAEVASYTKGRGRISLSPGGYKPCHNCEEIIANAAYSPESDLENTPDSVFCSHGSSFTVSWQETENYMHLEPTLVKKKTVVNARQRNFSISEDELESIMQKIAPKKEQKPKSDGERINERINKTAEFKQKPETRPRLLIVDGYNIVFAWEELRELAAVNIDSACGRLADILSNYAGYKQRRLMLVFDAYKTPAVTPHKIKAEAIDVIYTASGQTSDAFIESFCSENRKKFRIKVATNDGLVQLSVMRAGALRMTANELKKDVEAVNERIREIIKNNNT